MRSAPWLAAPAASVNVAATPSSQNLSARRPRRPTLRRGAAATACDEGVAATRSPQERPATKHSPRRPQPARDPGFTRKKVVRQVRAPRPTCVTEADPPFRNAYWMTPSRASRPPLGSALIPHAFPPRKNLQTKNAPFIVSHEFPRERLPRFPKTHRPAAASNPVMPGSGTT